MAEIGSASALIGALEVGGTHVTSALVCPDSFTVVAGSVRRRPLAADGTAADLLDALVAAGRDVDRWDADRSATDRSDTDRSDGDRSVADEGATGHGAGRVWGVALPGPFDYRAGVGRYRDVGKFDSLAGVDVGAALRSGLATRRLRFVNDADAFVLGQWASGGLAGTRRCAGFTLGTGIGSGFVVDGSLVHSGPGVPPEGRIHAVQVDGHPLEDLVSRRAVRRAYGRRTGDEEADVVDIADRARVGEDAALGVLRTAFERLGAVLGPSFDRFGAERVVVGGSMALSWDLLEPWFAVGQRAAGATAVDMVVAASTEESALAGAAQHAISDPR